MEIKKIFKRELALNLSNLGHQIVYTEPNNNYPKFRVFCFIETQALLQDLTTLTTQ